MKHVCALIVLGWVVVTGGQTRKIAAVRDVPAGQDGRAWSLQGYKGWTPLQPLNFPARFAFSPDALLVPQEAAAAERRGWSACEQAFRTI